MNKYSASSCMRTAQKSSTRVVLDYHTNTFICKYVRSFCFGNTTRCNDCRAGIRQKRASCGIEIVWKILQILEKFLSCL